MYEPLPLHHIWDVSKLVAISFHFRPNICFEFDQTWSNLIRLVQTGSKWPVLLIGNILKGYITKGYILKGYIAKGYIIKGNITKGYITKGYNFKRLHNKRQQIQKAT